MKSQVTFSYFRERKLQLWNITLQQREIKMELYEFTITRISNLWEITINYEK